MLKKVICSLLLVCIIVPVMSIGAFAGAATPDISWRNNSSTHIYFDGYDITTAAAHPTDTRYRIVNTTSGTQIVGVNDEYGVDYAKYNNGTYYLQRNYDNLIGHRVRFYAPDNFNQDVAKYKYLSFRYMVVNADETYNNTMGTFTCHAAGAGTYTAEFQGQLVNNTWQTVTVDLTDVTNWSDDIKKGYVFLPGGFSGIWMPVINQDAYYVIDYLGMYETENAALEDKRIHDAFSVDETIIPRTPLFSIPGNTYTSVQSVEIIKPNDTAEIYYTTNGATPNKSSTPYTGAITVDTTQTIKAIAYVGDEMSTIASATYTIDLTLCNTPIFSTKGGVVPKETGVKITSTTEGASIYYTTNGTIPSKNNGTLYEGPVAISVGMTLKAIAVKDGYTDSAVVSQEYTKFLDRNIFWSFSGFEGTEKQNQGVYMSAAGLMIINNASSANKLCASNADESIQIPLTSNELSVIFYPEERNGVTPVIPNSNWNYITITYKSDAALQLQFVPHYFQLAVDESKWSTPYDLPASQNEYNTVVIDMNAVSNCWESNPSGGGHFGLRFLNANGGENLTLLSANFFVDQTDAEKVVVSKPSASVESGYHKSEISVELTSVTQGASIYYTTDGSTPSKTNGVLYSSAIVINKDTTLKAIAVMDNAWDSNVATFEYEVTPTVSAPIVNLDAGKYEGTQKIEISCATDGAKIYYTLDGTNPSAENGTLYEGAFEISENCILKVIAVKDDMADSKITGRNYQITAVAATESDTDTDNVANAFDTEETENKKGCKSAISAMTVTTMMALSVAGVAVCKKKKD